LDDLFFWAIAKLEFVTASMNKLGGQLMNIDLVVIFGLLQSKEKFPVDFDDALGWWDCRTRSGKPARKSDLKEKLESNFIKGIDYVIGFAENSAKLHGGRTREIISVSVECFKMMGMMVSGVRGRQIRQYFIDCEIELKRRLEEEAKEEQFNTQKRLVFAMVSEDIVSRKPKFPVWFYEMLYRKRGQGWEKRDPQKFRPACVGTWTNQTVYDRLLGGVEPGGVKDVLDTVNPRQPNGVRKHRHHWHLKDLGEFHLQTHLYALSALANTVPDGDWDRFMRKVAQAFPNGKAIQLTLLDILEEMEEIGYPSALPT
jgi:phage anti-repressor protein